MSDADDLSEALRRYDEVVGEYVQVHQQLHDGLPPARRKPRWWLPLAILSVLVLALPLGIVVGRAHFQAPSTVAPLTGWPDATNTGVPAGTSLTAYTGSCFVTADNTVISQKTVDCTSVGALVIQAANVQITKSKVLGQVYLETDTAGASGRSFSLTDSEVDAGFVQLPAVGLGNYTILRSNIHGGETAVQCESGSVALSGDLSVSCDIQDSYLHGQDIPDGANWHLGGFLTEGGDNTILLRHNYVICDAHSTNVDGGCTGDINMIPNFGVITNVTIDHNKLGASTELAYCTFGGEKTTSPTPHSNHIVYTDNVFERGTNGLCGGYGPWTDFGIDPVNNAGNTWTNNRYDDGTLITVP